MPGSPAPPPAFRAERFELGRRGLWLSPIRPEEAVVLGTVLATIEPWSRYGTSPANLTALFMPSAVDGGIRLALRTQINSQPIGVVIIRHPWLAGPYMQFLAIVPSHQGQGYGRTVLDWFEAEARAGGARNTWICAVSFNEGARRLYTSCSYEQVAILDDLIQPGFDEVLMRKKLSPSDS